MEITNGFSRQNVIGEGGFGYVYKGQLPDGRVVAVKQLKAGSGQGEREFRAEVEIISRVHHRHLVSLVGYCISEQQRMLIYEFVPNKTLEHHMHGKGKFLFSHLINHCHKLIILSMILVSAVRSRNASVGLDQKNEDCFRVCKGFGIFTWRLYVSLLALSWLLYLCLLKTKTFSLKYFLLFSNAWICLWS